MNYNSAFSDLSLAVRSARESHNLTIQQVANLSDCETMMIEDIEAGKTDIMFSEIQILVKTLNVMLNYHYRAYRV